MTKDQELHMMLDAFAVTEVTVSKNSPNIGSYRVSTIVVSLYDRYRQSQIWLVYMTDNGVSRGEDYSVFWGVAIDNVRPLTESDIMDNVTIRNKIYTMIEDYAEQSLAEVTYYTMNSL